jgi:hypothetical protein
MLSDPASSKLKFLFILTEEAFFELSCTGCGKKTSPISNGSYKQIKKDTEKIL